MVYLPRYAPPPLAERWFNHELLEMFPNHPVDLLYLITSEYIRFWRLLITFPKAEIVSPGPINLVHSIHQSNREMYREDCMNYLNWYLGRERWWTGSADAPERAFVTVTSYERCFKETPPEPWADMTRLMGIGQRNNDDFLI